MRSRLSFIALVLVMAAIGLGIALTAYRVDSLATQLEESQADRAALHDELDEEAADSAALWAQVKRLGGKPVVDPAGAPTQGERGPGPTESQVKAAVADYCAGDRCKPTVSRSQVAAAVAAYCSGGLCQGKDGTDGGPGTDGTDGANGANGADGADGAPGPGPTDEQIAAAVAAYCADGKCQGEPGQPGKDGTNGADGKDATITPSGMDCPAGERVSGVHLLADGSLTVSCAPLLGRGD